MHWVFCLLLCVTACVRSSLETQTVRSLLLYTCKPWKSDIFANSLHKHIWLYAFTTLDRPVSVSQKCTDLCADNFEINLIGQLPVALEAGSVLSRVALWGCFEEHILTQFLLLCNRDAIRNKTDSVFAQPENVQFEQSRVRWTIR